MSGKHCHEMVECEIVADLLATTAESELDALKTMSRGDLIGLHFTAGQAIRNHYGLWVKPMASRSAVAPETVEVALDLESDEPLKFQDDYFRRDEDPDEISMRIIVALWQKVRGEG